MAHRTMSERSYHGATSRSLRLMRRERVFRDRTNSLDTFIDAELVKRYRLSRV